jgi:type III secretory pathway component EscV
MSTPRHTTITPEMDAQMRSGFYRATVGGPAGAQVSAAASSAAQGPGAAAAPPRLKVFLSHSSPDKALARRLARDLQSAHVEVWLDQWQIGVGESFEQRIAQGLDDTDFVIVLLTRQAVASEWVNREWRKMVEREAGTRRIAVLPVRAERCELPDFLAQRSHADIAGGSYVPGFRHLLHLLRHYGDDRGIVLADAAARAEAQRRRAHLLEIERINLGLDRPQDELQEMLPVVAPIALEVARDLIPLVAPDGQGASRALDELAPQVRDALERQYGFVFPGIRIRGNTSHMPSGSALVLIDELPESMFSIDPQKVLVNATPEQLAALGVKAEEFFDPACGRIACVPAAERGAVEGHGLEAMDATMYLFHAVFEVVRRMPHEFLGLDEVHRLLSALPTDLVRHTVPAVVSLIDLTQVLRALLQEDIGIGNLQPIVEALSQRDLQHDGIDECIELARRSLSAQIGAKVLAGKSALRVLVAGAQVETLMLGGLQRTASGNLLALEPDSLQQLLAAVRHRMQALGDTAEGVVLLVADAHVRPYLRRLVMLEFPKLHVLSRQDLPADLPLQVVGEFGVEA